MKRLQLVRKKLLPLLLCVAVAGSQVPVMAADVEGFSDSAEGFNEEWSEDTQTQSAEAEDTTETAEGNTTENTAENTGKQNWIAVLTYSISLPANLPRRKKVRTLIV